MRVVARLFPRALAVTLAAVAAVALLGPRNTWFVLPTTTTWVVMALVLLLWWAARRLDPWTAGLVERRPRAAVVGGAAVGGLVVALHLPLTVIDWSWDARTVYWAAERFAGGIDQTDMAVDYFAKFPNNIPTVVLQGTVIRLGALVGMPATGALLFVQGLLVVLAIACLGSVVVRLGRPAAVWPVQALATVVLGLNTGVGTPYNDLPTAAFVSLALWAAALAWTGAGRGWWVLALACLVVAVTLKAYAVALALGALALAPALVARLGRALAGVTLAGVAAVLLVGVLGLHALAAQVSDLPEERRAQHQPAFPPEHFLAMGTYDSQERSPTRTYGGWSGLHHSGTGGIKDPEERRAVLRQMVVDQVGERGVTGNAVFFAKKIAWTWGDGTFWAHGEGVDRERPGWLDGQLGETQQWFIGGGEPYRQHTSGVLQGVWLATLAITATGLWRARPDPWVNLTALTLIVLAGYLTLFEARPRYLVVLLPVLLLATGLTTGRGPRLRSERTALNTRMP